MSVLAPEVTVELTQMLQALQSPDNNVRTQAEDHLATQWTNSKPEMLLMGLAEQIQDQQDAATRSFAAVIFRRIASKPRKLDSGRTVEMFLGLEENQAAAIRQKLLATVASETSRPVRNKISDAVAEVARQYTENGVPWPELLGALWDLSQAMEPEKRETAFRVFTTTPSIIEKQQESAVQGAFQKGFTDPAVSVQLVAMEAFAAFFRTLTKKSQTKYWPLAPNLIAILQSLKESDDSDELSKALVALIDLAETAPKMFKAHFKDLVGISIGIVKITELDDICRQNALELMATFADYAPSMCRKEPEYTSEMITQCLSLMTDLGDGDEGLAEWIETDDLEQDESDQNHVAGEQTMDRLANKLGGETILAPTFNWLSRMMQSSWQDQHAALMAISAISEGCRELMLGELEQVLNLVYPALSSPHPRVRWAGCNALGQMSTDFAPTMQKDHHAKVLSALIPVLDSPEDRVKSHAAAALVNFCEEAEKTVLEPYLSDLLTHLFTLLQAPKRYVQEQALSTIATIADAAETAFGTYYDNLMPVLLNLLENQGDKELRLLRAKAMECATLIALAVGKDRLGGDSTRIVNLLGAIQGSITETDDPQAQYLLHCWGRMCRVLGNDFLPYLSIVIPPLLELAVAKADIQLLDDEEQAEQMQSEEGWEIVPLKGKMIGIRTSTMDDKHMAIELLVVYAQVLEGSFAPFVADIMEKIALPGLAFFFHDPVRFVSAKLVPQLLSSYKKAYGDNSDQLRALWNSTVDKIIEVLGAEPAIETLAEMYQCFYESVEVVGKGCLDGNRMNTFMTAVQSAIEEYQERVKQRAEDKEGTTAEDAEDEAEELMYAIEEDQTLLSDINKAFHAVFKNHGAAFLPAWQQLMGVYQSFLASADATQRQWALCIVDDVLEYCGPDSFQYRDFIQNPLLAGCGDSVPAIRQAAAYGVGVAAHKGGPNWSQFLSGAMEYLFRATQVPDARGDDNVYATENACAAIAKVLHFNVQSVADPQAVVAQWLTTLPVTNDEEAAPYAYAYLATLMEQQHPAVIGQSDQMFMHVAAALGAEALQGETAVKVARATAAMIQATGLNAEALFVQFPEAQQAVIRKAFSG